MGLFVVTEVVENPASIQPVTVNTWVTPYASKVEAEAAILEDAQEHLTDATFIHTCDSEKNVYRLKYYTGKGVSRLMDNLVLDSGHHWSITELMERKNPYKTGVYLWP